MPIYKVVVSFEVEAESEEDARHAAQDAVYEPTVVVEYVKEIEE